MDTIRSLGNAAASYLNPYLPRQASSLAFLIKTDEGSSPSLKDRVSSDWRVNVAYISMTFVTMSIAYELFFGSVFGILARVFVLGTLQLFSAYLEQEPFLKQMASNINALEASIEKAESNNKELSERITQLSTLNTKLGETQLSLESGASNLKNEIVALEKQRETLLKEATRLKNSITESIAKHNELQQKADQAQTQRLAELDQRQQMNLEALTQRLMLLTSQSSTLPPDLQSKIAVNGDQTDPK